jgi:transcriptional regulator with XRE-family HTH domain
MLRSIGFTMATLGDRIRNCRQARSWTLEALAAKAGVSKGFLSDLENNEQKNPGVNYLRAIAGALGVTLQYLTTGRGSAGTEGEVRIPASLLAFAKEEQLSVNETMMLLDARRQIVSHRSDGMRSEDLEGFDWKTFYRALKPYLK